MFDAALPSGRPIRYQGSYGSPSPVRGVRRHFRSWPTTATTRPPIKSQNRLEQDALSAVAGALPSGVRPVVLADRGFARAGFLARLQEHRPQYVARIDEGSSALPRPMGPAMEVGRGGAFAGSAAVGRPTCVTASTMAVLGISADRRGALSAGESGEAEGAILAARSPRRAPVPLATSSGGAGSAARWYRQRGRIEQSFRDAESRFGLARVKVGSPERLGRLLMALTIASSWPTSMGSPESGILPEGFRASVSAWGRALA